MKFYLQGRWWMAVTLAVGLVLGNGIFSYAAANNRKPAAAFRLTDLNGKPLELASSKGKVVIVDFWATWCPPCRQEIPHFVELYDTYKNQGLEIIGISLDEGGPQVVQQFVQGNGINYPVAIGNKRVVQAYGGIRGIPTTFVIDKQGRIYKKYVGYQDKAVFEKDVAALLRE